MTQTKKRVLFVSSEMSPFLETSPLATVARMLPQALQEQENEIRILVPRFGVINERRNRLHEVVRLSGINISIDDNDNPLIIKVASIPQTKMQVYFLDNEDYFHRKYVFRDEAGKLFDLLLQGRYGNGKKIGLGSRYYSLSGLDDKPNPDVFKDHLQRRACV
jgi:starch synthase